ncbi:hypothetical protein SAMN04487857_103332 [Pseudomonas sp. ok272]|nr:hypothetical protein SAMN04487857_103332 [Pseudomonas sp. ok272]SFM46435.1 hypothetical protein SAMN04487858_103103 [Pseudomonas sp. ok602]
MFLEIEMDSIRHKDVSLPSFEVFTFREPRNSFLSAIIAYAGLGYRS